VRLSRTAIFSVFDGYFFGYFSGEKTWHNTLRYDLQAMDVSWEEAKSVAGDRREWRSLVAQYSNGNRRT